MNIGPPRPANYDTPFERARFEQDKLDMEFLRYEFYAYWDGLEFKAPMGANEHWAIAMFTDWLIKNDYQIMKPKQEPDEKV